MISGENLEQMKVLKTEIDSINNVQTALKDEQVTMVDTRELNYLIPDLNDQLEDLKVKKFQEIEVL